MIAATRTLHGKDAQDVFTNAGQATLFSVTIICRKNWDCISYIESETWFWSLLGVTPSLLTSVGSRDWMAAVGKVCSRCRWAAYRGCPPCSVPVLVGEPPSALSRPAASFRQVVQATPSGNHCCIIWQQAAAGFLFVLSDCLVVCFCCNTLTPADSMGGKGRCGNLVAFAVFPDRRIFKHFFLM